MKSTMRRVLTPVIMAFAIAVFSAGAAFAAIVYPPEGGTWYYGTNSTTVWSEYYHPTRCHGATSVGTYTDSRTAGANVWARTSAPVKRSGNAAYYRTTC